MCSIRSLLLASLAMLLVAGSLFAQTDDPFFRTVDRLDDATPTGLFDLQTTQDGTRLIGTSFRGVITLYARDGGNGGLELIDSLTLPLRGSARGAGLGSAGPGGTGNLFRAPTLHPNDRHLFVFGSREIMLVERSIDDDTLRLVDRFEAGEDALAGVSGSLYSAALSPDGRHLYLFVAEGGSSVALLVADIDPDTGAPSNVRPSGYRPTTFESVLQGGRTNRHMVLSGAQGGTQQLSIVRRDPSNGSLTALAPVGGLDVTLRLVPHTEPGTTEDTWTLLGLSGLYRLRITGDMPALSLLVSAESCCGEPVLSATGIQRIDDLVLVSRREELLVFEETAPETLALRETVPLTEPGRSLGSCRFGTASTARTLYCPASGQASTIVAAEVRSDGRVEPIVDVFAGTRPADAAASASALVLSPDARHLYALVPDGFQSVIGIHSIDAEARSLDSLDTVNPSAGLMASLMTMRPDGRNVYTTGFRGLDVFTRDPRDGVLRHLEGHGLDTPESPFREIFDAGTDLAVSPGGRHLFVASQDTEAALCPAIRGGRVITATLADDGSIVETTAHEDVDAGPPIKISLSPDGRHLYVVRTAFACQPDHPFMASLSVLSVDPSTGALERVQRIDDAFRFFFPSLLFQSPDGRFVYVWAESLSIYERDPRSGRLQLTATQDLPREGNAVQTPDGRWVLGDTRYRRDADTGRLTAIDAPAVDGAALALAPDGESLFRSDAGGIDWLARTCTSANDSLCLRAEDRFRVEVDWETPNGRRGSGRLVADGASDRSGLLYFFRPDNWEMLVKIIDGCTSNNRFWVFAAATTNVAYNLRVTDTWSGETAVYENAQGNASPAITDTNALATCAAPGPSTPTALGLIDGSPSPQQVTAGAPTRTLTSATGRCTDTDQALCLRDGRFRFEVDWETADRQGRGTRVDIAADDSGLFSFFTPSNWEMLVKVIDGCAINGHQWIFGAATTNVSYRLTVTDTETGERLTYENPLGTAAPAIVDTQAFDACP